MKKIFLGILCFATLTLSAQTPQWNWAKGVGGTQQDYALGGININAMHADRAGNVYQVITGQSSAYTFGAYHFINPYGTGAIVAYFIKYNANGTVLWAKSFPQYPAAVGGGNITPQDMFITDKGNAYLLFTFRDSLRLGGLLVTDTVWSLTHTGKFPYCIAEYDPDGNVIALTAHAAKNSGIQSIRKFNGNKILAYGVCENADTISNMPVKQGHFLAIMDSTGAVLRIKTLGYDSVVQFLSAGAVTTGSNSVYIQPSFYQSFIYQDAMPIGSVGPYEYGSTMHLLIKFDSLLNFQWSKPVNYTLFAPTCTDKDDNIYLAGSANSSPVPDTLIYDTTHVVLPYLPPYGMYKYHIIVKVSAAGLLQWTKLLPEVGTGSTQCMCTDPLNNLYLAGTYVSSLITGIDTLTDPANIFVVKLLANGQTSWAQSTHLGGRLQVSGMGSDGYGNIYMNGNYADPNFPVAFGHDTLTCTPPVANYPLAPDVFTARLGACNPVPPTLSSASPLQWCGNDSVILTATAANTYLWANGDTSQVITVNKSGIYTVYAIDTLGCYAQSKADTINAYLQPVLMLNVSDVLCNGDSTGKLYLNTLNANGTVHYAFAPLVFDTTKLAAGIYAVTVTDSAGCTATATGTVHQPNTKVTLQISYYPIANGHVAEAIGTAAGGTPGYSFSWQPGLVNTDTFVNPAAGSYQLMVSDSNGCTATATVVVPATTGVSQILSAKAISVYPNPATGSFYIETSADGELKIYDALGNIVHRQKISAGKTSIQCQVIAKGIYTIELVTATDNWTGNIIVN